MRKFLALAAVLAAASTAQAQQAGVQYTRERDATLISKDVGDERWAITYRLSDGRATGNVYPIGGGAVTFLDCPQVGADGTDVIFDCYAADACAAAPCPESQYSLVASGLVFPLAFFFPPGDATGPATLEDLIGRWRFVIDGGDDVTMRLDRVEQDDGDEFVVGENEETENDVIVFATEGGFTLLDESTFGCQRYEFDFTTIDRLDGTRFETVFLPLLGDCEDDPTDTDPFFAERIE